jgi:hypothetical protein
LSAEDLQSALEQLAEVLQTQRTLGVALARIAEAAVTSVPGCDAASIALSVEGRPVTSAASARVALELDMVQYDLDDGPCLTSFRNIEALRLDLVGPGEAFPHFAVAARSRGVVGVMSLPATWGNDLVATLNLYSRTGPFDETAQTVGAVLAAQVAIAASRSPEFAAARGAVEEAQRDADDQSQVDIAKGLLMGTQGCTAEQAEGLLQGAAQHEEQTILQIAQRIIADHHDSG